jgi:hypothetical protein
MTFFSGLLANQVDFRDISPFSSSDLVRLAQRSKEEGLLFSSNTPGIEDVAIDAWSCVVSRTSPELRCHLSLMFYECYDGHIASINSK